MTQDHRNPVLRVVPGPSDINANGHIFGGWVLSQMDIAAGIVASRRAGGAVATVAIDKMEFIEPIHLRDVISVYAQIERVGRTSMAIRRSASDPISQTAIAIMSAAKATGSAWKLPPESAVSSSAKTSGLSLTPFASVSSVEAAWRSRSSAAPITWGWQRRQ